MKTVIICECTQKIREGNKITGYKLRDKNGAEIKIDSETLKKYIKSGQMQVLNLTLTSNNRLVDKAKEVPLHKIIRLLDELGKYIQKNTEDDFKIKYNGLIDDDTYDVAALISLRDYWITDEICIDICVDIMSDNILFYINIVKSNLSSSKEYDLENKINKKVKRKVSIKIDTDKEQLLNTVKMGINKTVIDTRELLVK